MSRIGTLVERLREATGGIQLDASDAAEIAKHFDRTNNILKQTLIELRDAKKMQEDSNNGASISR